MRDVERGGTGSDRGELVLDLPAAHSAGRMGRQLVRQFAVREGMAETDIETLEFVTSELLSNAVDHGGGNSAMEEADLENDVPVAPETVFRLGSITKQFTAAIVLQLAEEGALGLDDPIGRLLPDYPSHDALITVSGKGCGWANQNQ